MAKRINKNENKNMVNNETKVVCPNCGAEFAIPSHTTLAVGVVIGKDSGLGTISPALANHGCGKVDARIQAMQAHGIDTSKFFAVANPDGGEDVLMTWKDGIPTPVADDDPILATIMEKGEIPNRNLFRRWVMAQVFHMMQFKGWDHHADGFTGALQYKGYMYSWKMIAEEMKVQMKLWENGDFENFRDRNIWFNKELVVTMMQHYLDLLRKDINDRRTRHCKGVDYKRFAGRDVFVADLYKKIYWPIMSQISKVEHAKDPRSLYLALRSFTGHMIHLSWGTAQCKDWMDAYKGCGAFYTLKNLIMFHGCYFYVNKRKLNKQNSLGRLQSLATKYATDHEGFCLLGALKQFLKDNKIDIAKKIAEWRKK